MDETILCIACAGNVAFRNVVTELGTAEASTCRCKNVAIDNDKKHITVRVDSTLTSSGNLLILGVGVLISKSIPMFWNYEDRNDVRCEIFMQEFKIVGQHPAPDESLVGPSQNKRAILVNVKKKVFTKRRSKVQMQRRTQQDANRLEPCVLRMVLSV